MPIYQLVPIDPMDVAWGVTAVSLSIDAPSEDVARERAVALTLARLRSRRRGRAPAHMPWLYAAAAFCTTEAPQPL